MKKGIFVSGDALRFHLLSSSGSASQAESGKSESQYRNRCRLRYHRTAIPAAGIVNPIGNPSREIIEPRLLIVPIVRLSIYAQIPRSNRPHYKGNVIPSIGIPKRYINQS